MVTWQRWPPHPYMVKDPLNVFSGTKSQWPWDLVCSIGDVGPTRFAQMINLGWPWHTLWQGQIWFLMHLFGKNLVLSTKSQADLWPFIPGHSFGLPHTYLNICFSEITGLFDGLFIRLFKGKRNKWKNVNCICSRCVTQHKFDENRKMETIEYDISPFK